MLSFEDAEQRPADVRVNSAANETRNCGTSPQEELELGNERKERTLGNQMVIKIQDMGSDHCNLRNWKLEISSQLDKTKNNRTSVVSKTSSAGRVLHLELKVLEEHEELQTR